MSKLTYIQVSCSVQPIVTTLVFSALLTNKQKETENTNGHGKQENRVTICAVCMTCHCWYFMVLVLSSVN